MDRLRIPMRRLTGMSDVSSERTGDGLPTPSVEVEGDTAVPGGRLDSIDIMRAVAILLMVQIHFVEILSRDPEWGSILNRVVETLGTAAAPIFTFLVGMSLYLAIIKQQSAGVTRGEIAARNWRRGVFILFVGFLFNVVIWMPREVFSWDILTFIGAAILIVFSLRRLSPASIILIAVVILLASPALRSVSGYAAHWITPNEYAYQFTMKDVTLGFLLNGYFPLFPWLVFPLSGLATAKYFLGGNTRRDARGLTLPVVGAVLVLLSAAGIVLNSRVGEVPGWYLANNDFYPATTSFIIGALGIVILLFWALHRWVDDRSERENHALAFCRRYSRFSLTTYIVHHAVLVWPLLLAATLSGKADPWFYFENACGTPVALVLAVVFIALFYALIVVWDRHGSRYSLEWFERKFSG